MATVTSSSSSSATKTILLQLFRRCKDVVPLPAPHKRNVLITSALPYVNNEPHLGNIIGCVLSADAFARFSRLIGDKTLYVCGTDEYGTATETKAIEEKTSCKELCDKYYAIHKQIYQDFDIDFDHFGRTTTTHQTEIAQEIYLNLYKGGHLVKETVTQLYCEKCERFLADRYVEGTCPGCGFADARGDQCDGCQKLLNAADLRDPRCKLDATRPVARESTHMFLDLSKFAPALEQHVADALARGDSWSANAVQTTRAWLKEGLRPRCITRDLKWGTPVPKTGDPAHDDVMLGKVFYVWFDAPIGYVSITADCTPDWRLWWQTQATQATQSPAESPAESHYSGLGNVQLYQFMGKDNTPFHTVIFPSSLLGSGGGGAQKWNLVRHISTTEYLTYEGSKFSKSRGTGVFGSHVRDSGIPVAVWRYYLFSSRPETSDADFNWDEFAARNNNELVKNPGNLVNRVVKFLWARYDGVVPRCDAAGAVANADAFATATDAALASDTQELVAQYVAHMRALRLRAALACAMALASRGNQYLSDAKLDNALLASAPARCAHVLVTALDLLCVLSALLYPFVPSASASINRQLGIPPGAQPAIPAPCPGGVPRAFAPGHKLGPQEYLFQRIDDSVIAALRLRHGGVGVGDADAHSAATNTTTSKSKHKNKKNDTTKPTSKRAAAASENAATNAYKSAEKALASMIPEEVPAGCQLLRDEIAQQANKIRALKSGRQPESSDANANVDVDAEVAVLRALKEKLVLEAATSCVSPKAE